MPADDLTFTARYLIHRDGPGSAPVGRLTVGLVPIALPGQGNRQMQLELTARGIPLGPGLDGILSFHNLAHDHIVRCFAGITTPAAHIEWERLQ